MSGITAYIAERVFDGRRLHDDLALLVEAGLFAGLVPIADIPGKAYREDLQGGVIAPGYVDLQVNGGGGIMFNDDPSVDSLSRIAAAHARLGSTAILPTLITDTRETTRAAIEAVVEAGRAAVPGVAGLHLEGPHLSLARKGAHDPALIRGMDESDLELLLATVQRVGVLMVTLAPESVTCEQIRTLSDAGVVLSLGHSDASFAACRAAAHSGATCVTHLFNAMSQLGNREPGMVGAALQLGELSAGLIADLVHVHGENIRLALIAKRPPGKVFLVTDAMATAGVTIDHFVLNGRRIERSGGRLTLGDGTLAGADLDLSTAIRNICALNVPLAQALAMATSVPAQVIRQRHRSGGISAGASADFVHLDDDQNLRGVWRGGVDVATD